MNKTVLFGAFDRHNLGDLLLARVAEREEEGPVVFAGLAARDMTPFGGPRVVPLEEAIAGGPIRLIHVGGEVLDCDAEQAAYMLGELGLALHRQCAYTVAKRDLPAGSTVEFRAVGGVALVERPLTFRDEVLAALARADGVTVRDVVTHDFLIANGIDAELVPDPVGRVAALFGEEILARKPVLEGYAAVQFAAEWGDDATLAQLAHGLDRIGRPVVLFRAGAAPWHDDLEPYRRLAARLTVPVPVSVFESLNIWDICGLIAGARLFVGSSLHGRIVARAFVVPAMSIEQQPGSARKLHAYLRTWRPEARVVVLDDFAGGEGIGK